MKTKLIIGLLMSLLSMNSWSITVNELKEKLDKNEKVVIIDLRSNLKYKNNHIIGAINIPIKILENKRLPPFKSVVIYDDGLLSENSEHAKNIIENKINTNVEILQGGFKAWNKLQVNLVSKDNGLELPDILTINYQDLKAMDADESKSNIVIDIRKLTEKENLNLHFNHIQIIELPMAVFNDDVSKQLWEQLVEKSVDQNQSIILIGDGDHIADRLSVYLSANNNFNVMLLGGGEKSLHVKGESKLKSRTDGVVHE